MRNVIPSKRRSCAKQKCVLATDAESQLAIAANSATTARQPDVATLAHDVHRPSFRLPSLTRRRTTRNRLPSSSPFFHSGLFFNRSSSRLASWSVATSPLNCRLQHPRLSDWGSLPLLLAFNAWFTCWTLSPRKIQTWDNNASNPSGGWGEF